MKQEVPTRYGNIAFMLFIVVVTFFGYLSSAIQEEAHGNWLLSLVGFPKDQDARNSYRLLFFIVNACLVACFTFYTKQREVVKIGLPLQIGLNELLAIYREQLLEEASNDRSAMNSDQMLKLTVFVPRNLWLWRHPFKTRVYLEAYARAGGDSNAPCNHTFPTEGEGPGVAGTAYWITDPVTAFKLPNLDPSNLPDQSLLTDRIRNYARKSYLRFEDVNSEFERKRKKRRAMARSLYGLRIKNGNEPALGVIVVDSRSAELNASQQEIIGDLCRSLRHLLKGLER